MNNKRIYFKRIYFFLMNNKQIYSKLFQTDIFFYRLVKRIYFKQFSNGSISKGCTVPFIYHSIPLHTSPNPYHSIPPPSPVRKPEGTYHHWASSPSLTPALSYGFRLSVCLSVCLFVCLSVIW